MYVPCGGAGTGTLDLYVSLDGMKNELWLSPPVQEAVGGNDGEQEGTVSLVGTEVKFVLVYSGLPGWMDLRGVAGSHLPNCKWHVDQNAHR